jgi:hypothetical protein
MESSFIEMHLRAEGCIVEIWFCVEYSLAKICNRTLFEDYCPEPRIGCEIYETEICFFAEFGFAEVRNRIFFEGYCSEIRFSVKGSVAEICP